MMLGRLMNAGLLSQARQLASIFEHDSPDLTIVLVRVDVIFCVLVVTICLCSAVSSFVRGNWLPLNSLRVCSL